MLEDAQGKLNISIVLALVLTILTSVTFLNQNPNINLALKKEKI